MADAETMMRRVQVANLPPADSGRGVARLPVKQYTLWGQVESGMEHVDALPVGEPPREPGKIVKASVA